MQPDLDIVEHRWPVLPLAPAALIAVSLIFVAGLLMVLGRVLL